MKQQPAQFSNRWGLILAALGMAIGAGNLWRFPRLAGQYGGTFLVLWFFFLLVWSIPILMAEFAIGKTHKQSVIGSFARMAGKQYTWMGWFIALCTIGILFYYSVVTAWGLRYLILAVGDLWAGLQGNPTLVDHLAQDATYLETYWTGLSSGDWFTVALHGFSIALGAIVLIRGIQGGLEKANKILIPTLFILLLIVGGVALSMANGIKGLDYMFGIKPELFRDSEIWIQALTQSAWSTGAGWGLIMTLSAYSRKKEDVTLNVFISGFGNNTASLVAGMAILPAVFALAANENDAITYLQSGNQALTFTIIPKLFTQITGGAWLAVVFFLAFFLAAFSSLLAMQELLIKSLENYGLKRVPATIAAAVTCLVRGSLPPGPWIFSLIKTGSGGSA